MKDRTPTGQPSAKIHALFPQAAGEIIPPGFLISPDCKCWVRPSVYAECEWCIFRRTTSNQMGPTTHMKDFIDGHIPGGRSLPGVEKPGISRRHRKEHLHEAV
jgi:hypothetical protein